MAIEADIRASIRKLLTTSWDQRDGQVVPQTADVALQDGAVNLEAAYLYADMADSTRLAQSWKKEAAAKAIRAFLDGACRVIRAEGGQIRSFDGDRVMAIFIGKTPCTTAARCALKINYAVGQIMHEELKDHYSDFDDGKKIGHCTGIDFGTAMLVRGGVRGNNDLVSIGGPPNIAAKLSGVRSGAVTLITPAVYGRLLDGSKYGNNGSNMWTSTTVNLGGNWTPVYSSTWWWSP